MKLKNRLFIAFFITIMVPIVLLAVLLVGVFVFQAGRLRVKYGIDLSDLQQIDKTLIADILFFMITILVITAVIMAFWLYRGINMPLSMLTRAAKNIRDGNLDFEISQDESVEEIKELSEAFEQMRSRLKQANEAKVVFDEQNRELISNISHDLRTPITAIKGYCEGLMDGVADTPEKRDRYIRTIYNKTTEMDRLINELSFYSKITTNRIPYTFDRVNVKSFFDDAAEEIGDDLQAKGFEFRYIEEVSENEQFIADIEQITRVLNNIIGNAVKYADKPNKRIIFHVSVLGDEIVVSVKDNGKGIAARDLPNIFDRFYRTDSSRNSKEGGSGIGLSIVKKIIEDHGGRVWASSEEGEGTTVSFSIRRYVE